MVKRYIGFSPYFHQKAVIEELRNAKGTGKVVVCKSSRQKGKSFMIANLLLYYSINYCNTKNYCLSPSFKQAKNIYQTIVDAIIKSGVIKSKNKTDLVITLINGSTINFKSAEQREQLRGYTADFLCIDEAAYIPDSIFHLVLPWTDAKKAPLLMVSSPFVKNGFFFQYYSYGIEKSHNTVTIDWSNELYKESIEQILSAEKLEEYRQVLPRNVFLTEYLGEWLDDEGTVFTNIKACIKNCKLEETDKLYIGIDWSNQGENDYTVISAFNQNGNQVYLKYFNNTSPLRQIQIIVQQLEPIAKQIGIISCESNSIGTPYTELLKEKSQILAQKVVLFNTSNTSKNAGVLNLQTAMENGDVTLLDDDKQKSEFSYFSASFNPKTRNVTYAAPQGLNDDVVMATVFAYDAYKNGSTIGVYNVTMTKKTITGKPKRKVTKGISYIGK